MRGENDRLVFNEKETLMQSIREKDEQIARLEEQTKKWHTHLPEGGDICLPQHQLESELSTKRLFGQRPMDLECLDHENYCREIGVWNQPVQDLKEKIYMEKRFQ